MKKILLVAAALMLALVTAGFSVAEDRQYVEVARARGNKALRELVPLSGEIDRLDLVLRKLDQQVAANQQQLITARAALTVAESNLADVEHGCQSLLSDMRQIRGLGSLDGCGNIRVGCRSISKAHLKYALAWKLTAWKRGTAIRSAHRDSVANQRAAVARLAADLNEWQEERSLLSSRLETLRTRLASHDLKTRQAGFFSGTDLTEAKRLASEIESRMERAEGTSVPPSPSPTPQRFDATSTNDIVSEIDAILKANQGA